MIRGPQDAKAMLLAITAATDEAGIGAAITAFQSAVWNRGELTGNTEIDDVLAELALDLDYFEPDPVKRREDASYYDETELRRIVAAGLDAVRRATDD